MLRNCKAARVLPRIAESAKHDRNAILRARYTGAFISSRRFLILWKLIPGFLYRCCEYALLTLEHWPDAPEIQRSVELYEDLIRCCVADAMSEVGLWCRFPYY